MENLPTLGNIIQGSNVSKREVTTLNMGQKPLSKISHGKVSSSKSKGGFKPKLKVDVTKKTETVSNANTEG